MKADILADYFDGIDTANKCMSRLERRIEGFITFFYLSVTSLTHSSLINRSIVRPIFSAFWLCSPFDVLEFSYLKFFLRQWLFRLPSSVCLTSSGKLGWNQNALIKPSTRSAVHSDILSCRVVESLKDIRNEIKPCQLVQRADEKFFVIYSVAFFFLWVIYVFVVS